MKKIMQIPLPLSANLSTESGSSSTATAVDESPATSKNEGIKRKSVFTSNLEINKFNNFISGRSIRRKKTTSWFLGRNSLPTTLPTSPLLRLSLSGSGESQANADYRVAVFGAGGVGKSSIVLRFIKNSFSEAYLPTIEDIYQQIITCNQKNICTLYVIDTTGSHTFPAMQRLSISKGNAFLIVYSVTSRQSFEDLTPIFHKLKEIKGEQISSFPIMLVGNKIDETQKREVTPETGAKLAEDWGCGFIETSAKTSENITKLFKVLLTMEKKRNLALSIVSEEDENTEVSKTSTRRKCLLM